MQEKAEGDFDLVEDQGLAANYSAEGRDLALSVFLPMRHLAWASNINKGYVSAYGYGIAISQAACFASMDQLGVAQYLTRLGMAFNDIDALGAAKEAWLQGTAWQELRHFVEDLMVEKDWFALLVAQDFAIEGLLYPLIYDGFNDKLNAAYGPVFSLLTRFQREWFAETSKWMDAVLRVAAAESPDNQALLADWIGAYRDRAIKALKPIARLAFADQAEDRMGAAVQQLNARAAKAGITL
jgi:phenol hydroxylase P1 protein